MHLILIKCKIPWEIFWMLPNPRAICFVRSGDRKAMLKPRTVFIIFALISLLFLQIEAANAGLLGKWRQVVEQTLSPVLIIGSGVVLMVFALVYFAVFDKSLNINETQEPKH
jgi:hypothetical protein